MTSLVNEMTEIRVDFSTLQGLGVYVLYGLHPGSFGVNLLVGDLEAARASAHELIRDTEIPGNLIDLIQTTLPACCYGSVEAVEAWMAHNGLAGASEDDKMLFKLSETNYWYDEFYIGE